MSRHKAYKYWNLEWLGVLKAIIYPKQKLLSNLYFIFTGDNALWHCVQLRTCVQWTACDVANSFSVKKFLAFYGKRWFGNVFTKAHHQSLFWTRWIQSTPSLSLCSFNIHLHIIYQSGLRFSVRSRFFRLFKQSSYAFLFSPARAKTFGLCL